MKNKKNVMLYAALLILIFHKTNEYKYFYTKLKNIFKTKNRQNY